MTTEKNNAASRPRQRVRIMQKKRTITKKKISNLRKPFRTGTIVGAVVVIYGLWAIDNFYSTREKPFARTKELSFSNGIINLGSGAGHYLSASAKKYALDSAVTANVDIGLDEGNKPNYYQANLNFRLPFEDNQFSCFFASHCLEHIPDWESALQDGWGSPAVALSSCHIL